jgi:hypothetical protein
VVVHRPECVAWRIVYLVLTRNKPSGIKAQQLLTRFFVFPSQSQSPNKSAKQAATKKLTRQTGVKTALRYFRWLCVLFVLLAFSKS